MAQLMPNPKQQYFDNNGDPLVGGKIYFYVVGTDIPRDTWQDMDKKVLNTNPVILDARGEAIILLEGNYRVVVRDEKNNLIYDIPVVSTTDGQIKELNDLIAEKMIEINAAVDRANDAADRAEDAAAAAIINAHIYPNEAAGRAAVADGEFFSVIGTGDVAYYVYQRIDANSSVLRTEIPSFSAVYNEIDDRKSLIDKAEILISGLDLDIASVEIDIDGRVVGFRENNGPIYRAGADGLDLLLDAVISDQCYVPTLTDELVSVEIDLSGRALSAVTSDGFAVSTNEGLHYVDPVADPAFFDLVVYGANVSGLCAAIAASREGKTALILEPTDFIGGAAVSGLAYQDFTSPGEYPVDSNIQTKNVLIRGISREIYSAIAPYNLNRALVFGETNQGYLNEFRGGPQNKTQPSDMREVFDRLIVEHGIQVRTGVRIDMPKHVWKRGKRITAIMTPAGIVRGRYFIDASYEGDLIKHSGAGYRYGRESEAEYGEVGAGYRGNNARSIYGLSDNNAYPIGPRPTTLQGEADDGCMGFCTRGVMTQEANRLPWPKPEGYDDNVWKFKLIADQMAYDNATAFVGNLPTKDTGTGARLHAYDLRTQTRVNWNSNPSISLDLIGQTKYYRDGNWAFRDMFVEELMFWNKGIFYFLANDPSVPEIIRTKANSWGLPADEFLDSPFGQGWPHYPYIRAGIRLRGKETLTGVHQVNGTKWATRVAAYSYAQDSKCCTLMPHPFDPTIAHEEGYINGPGVIPYEIPAEVMFEPEGGLENLLVPNLMSCTSVAWTAYRLEPALGMMGHAAGLLAVQCIERNDQPVQSYEYNDLRLRLNAGGFNF